MSKLMLFIIWAVNFASAFMAGSGIRIVTQENPYVVDGTQMIAKMAGFFEPTTWHFLFSLFVASLLQIVCNAFWTMRFRSGGLMPIVIGVGASALSAWVSAVFVVLAAEEVYLRQQSRLESIAPARTALTEFSDSMRATSQGLQAAAEQAAELERVETTVGGTCPGNNIASPGPRQRMRARHAAALSTASTNADSLAAEALQLDLNLQSTSADQLVSVFAQAVALSRDPRIYALERDLTPILVDLTTGWEDNGRTYTCPSPEFLATVNAAISNLDRLVPIPSDLPVESEPSTSDSSALLWQSLVAVMMGGIALSGTALGALGFATIVELFQIGMIGHRELKMRELGLSLDKHDEFWVAGKGRGRKRQHLPEVLAALERYRWFDGKSDIFAVPVLSDDIAARLPVSYFGMKLYHPSLRNFELEEIDPDWVAARNLQGHRFDLFAMPRKLQSWRRVADRDLQSDTARAV